MTATTLRLLTLVGIAANVAALSAAIAGTCRRRLSPTIVWSASACFAVTGSAAWCAAASGPTWRLDWLIIYLALFAGPALVAPFLFSKHWEGPEYVISTAALTVTIGAGCAWALRLGSRGPLLLASAALCGVGFGLLVGILLTPEQHLRRGSWLTSPWPWGVFCGAMVFGNWLFGRPQLTADGSAAIVGLRVFGIFLLPTEIAYKVGAPVFLALMAYEGFDDLRYRVYRLPWRIVITDPVVPLLIGTLFSMAFVLPLRLLGEHGTLALGLLLFLAVVVIVAGRSSLAVGSALVAVLAMAILAFVEPRLLARLRLSWTWSEAATGAGYQMAQAQIALASSRLVGTGIGLGRPGDVPLAANDFPIAAMGEELGIFGLGVVVLALTLLVTSVMRRVGVMLATSRTHHGHEHPEWRNAIVALALILAIAIQAGWSLFMNAGLLPIAGVPFPWLSASGTTTFATTAGATAAIWLTRGSEA